MTVTFDQGKLVYTVNMTTDLVSRIDIFRHETCVGFLAFDYMQALSEPVDDMSMPGFNHSVKGSYKPRNGLWLIDLINTVTHP